MSFFERLKTEASAEWRAYTEHHFIIGMADGTLTEAAFRHYLVQDYLFLIEFARASDSRRRHHQAAAGRVRTISLNRSHSVAAQISVCA